MDERPSRANASRCLTANSCQPTEPHDQGRDDQALPLRQPRPVANTSRRLPGSLQLRPTAQDAERPQALRIHLQNLDIRARSIHPKPDPPDAGTEHLGIHLCAACSGVCRSGPPQDLHMWHNGRGFGGQTRDRYQRKLTRAALAEDRRANIRCHRIRVAVHAGAPRPCKINRRIPSPRRKLHHALPDRIRYLRRSQNRTAFVPDVPDADHIAISNPQACRILGIHTRNLAAMALAAHAGRAKIKLSAVAAGASGPSARGPRWCCR